MKNLAIQIEDLKRDLKFVKSLIVKRFIKSEIERKERQAELLTPYFVK